MLVVPGEDLAFVGIVGQLNEILKWHGKVDLHRREGEIRVDVVDSVDVRLLLVVVLNAVEDAVGNEALTQARRIVRENPHFLRVQRVRIDLRGDEVSRVLLAVQQPKAVLVDREVVPARLRRVVERLAASGDVHRLRLGFRDQIDANDGVLVLDVVDETALVDDVVHA